uniref:WapI family immunity protein n=1 Tax=Thaumasiovibrio occultus TaxID=1891184 RepID=UPI000B35360A|nr:hypothetical protein [Thaumasiovibrio occultus]
MLTLIDKKNDVILKLAIEGYQFPDNDQDNWCYVSLLAAQGAERYKIVHPALETHNLIEILEWFQCLASGHLPHREVLVFIDPCLQFSLRYSDEKIVKIEIELAREMEPDFRLQQYGHAVDDWRVLFDLRREALPTLVAKMKAAIALYPMR